MQCIEVKHVFQPIIYGKTSTFLNQQKDTWECKEIFQGITTLKSSLALQSKCLFDFHFTFILESSLFLFAHHSEVLSTLMLLTLWFIMLPNSSIKLHWNSSVRSITISADCKRKKKKKKEKGLCQYSNISTKLGQCCSWESNFDNQSLFLFPQNFILVSVLGLYNTTKIDKT